MQLTSCGSLILFCFLNTFTDCDGNEFLLQFLNILPISTLRQYSNLLTHKPKVGSSMFPVILNDLNSLNLTTGNAYTPIISKLATGGNVVLMDLTPSHTLFHETGRILNLIPFSRQTPPTAVLFLQLVSSIETASLPGFDAFARNLHKISIPSLFFLVCMQSTEIFMLNLITTEKQLLSISKPSAHHLKWTSIQKLWNQIHSDFNEHDGCYTEVPTFVNIEFAERFNFSSTRIFYDYPEDNSILGNDCYSLSWQYSTRRYSSEEMERTILRKSFVKWLWSPTAVFYQYYDYVIFARRPPYSMAILLKPYDMSTWSGILVTLMAVSIFTVMDNTAKDNRVMLLISSLLGYIAFLLETPGNFLTRVCTKRPKLWFGLVILLFLVLSNGYKGCVVSFMANEGKPEVPKTLADLANSNMKLVTGDNKLARVIIPEIIAQAYASSVSVFKKILQRLLLIQDKVKLLRDDFSKNTIKKVIGLQTNEELVDIALITDERGVKDWIIIMSKLTDYYIIERNDPIIRQFFNIYSFLVLENFFAPIFIKELKQYYESGIVVLEEQHQMWKYKTAIIKEFSGNKMKENIYALIALCGGQDKEGERLKRRPRAFAIDRLYPIILLCVNVLSLAALMLIAERVVWGSNLFLKYYKTRVTLFKETKRTTKVVNVIPVSKPITINTIIE